MLAGRLRVGAVLSSTATVAVPVRLLPAPSVAEQVMVVLPTAKVVPEAGEQIGVSEPDTASVAVAVKVTTAARPRRLHQGGRSDGDHGWRGVRDVDGEAGVRRVA